MGCRRLYILRMYCKNCISFNFPIFFIIYMTYRKKKYMHLPQKNQFFFIIYATYRKIFFCTHLPQKKLPD